MLASVACVTVVLACVACRGAEPAGRGGGDPRPPAPPSAPSAPAAGAASLTTRVVGDGDGPVVVLLHGHGARADNLVPLVDALTVRPGMRFVFPEGPLALGGAARGWWPLAPLHVREAALASGGRNLSNEEPPGMRAARDALVALLREVPDRFGVAPGAVVVGGFSQGAMAAMDAALHLDEPPGVVVSMSGALVDERDWVPRMPALVGARVLVTHGRQDPLLPFAGSERLVARLREAGVSPRFVPFDGGHELPAPVIAAIRDELDRALPRAAAP